ncbi:alkaline phosphatase PhoX [Nonomuraea longicatena]|uniref:DUF839 domain-containing protein n=1 Tax=Nonomuraea longicatena TaxID=83682 RepID=A0ABN1PRZ2_9ACTN
MTRRTLLRAGAVTVAGPPWHSRSGAGPYGPLRPPEASGLALPDGFTGRLVARTGRKVAGLTWHPTPAAGACFPDGDGWIHVSNSAVPFVGGASALRFDARGTVQDAYRVLSGTGPNHAGAATPWQTWLSCERGPRGLVHECDPYGARAARPRLALGRFSHGSVACDPVHQVVYLTEDEPDGCLYRFRPRDWGDLTEGVLEVLTVADGWREVPCPAATATAARHQVPGALRLDRAEGCHTRDGLLVFATAGQVWAYDGGSGAPARDVLPPEDLFMAAGTEIDVVSGGAVVPFLRLTGHDESTLTGPAFSPDGSRLYFSSQRGRSGTGTDGHTFEVTGPFRVQRVMRGSA